MHDNLQICIPGLHISLGLFLKFFDMLVGECDELDTKIAWKLAESSSQLDGMGDLNEHFLDKLQNTQRQPKIMTHKLNQLRNTWYTF